VFEHRLLLLAEEFPPSLGGIQAYLSGLWAALPSSQACVVASTQPGDTDWDSRRAYQVTRASTHAWTYPRWRPAWQAARTLVSRERIEAVVCGKALFEGRAALRLQAEFGTPYIVCTYATEILTWSQDPTRRSNLRRVLLAAGRVVVINEPTRRAIRHFGVPESRMVKLYPGVSEDAFVRPEGVGAFRHQHGLTKKRVVATVARCIPRKGLDILLRAFVDVRRAVPAAQWVLIGDGPERPRLEALAEKCGLGSAVTFLGAGTREDVRRLLACAEVFCLTPRSLPNDEEGFGIVYLEAAAMGLPSVGSLVGGVPEAVLDGETGLLVPSNDQAATAGALIRLLQDDVLRTQLGRQAKTRAEREFHWKGRALLFQGMVHAMLTEQQPSFPGAAPQA
jgi:phosphatidylinositol alpha-1,6-mannosyltransferase